MTDAAVDRSPSRTAVLGVLALVLILRMLQLLSAMGSPLTFQPGPDEDYYLRFGQAVAAGGGAQDTPEFTFMDPAYGYILGLIFKLVGSNFFVVYLLQVLLDTGTAYGIVRAGKLLGRPRAGLIGAAIYGVTATAIMFCTTLLKEVWVTAFLTWWVVAALTVIRTEKKWTWLLFGLYTGLGVGLRSTQLVLGLAAVLLPFGVAKPPVGLKAAGLVLAGLVVALAPWSIRNNSLSPLPHNSGIVLHQVYNEQNPRAELWIPPFVSYLHPSEIWRGYESEAERRAGHALTPGEVNEYWHGQAMAYIEHNPVQVLADVVRKGLGGWFSGVELANNRSDVEERMFSSVLAVLPTPAPWLLGMGLAGLVWLGLQERRRVLIVAAPIALAWLTMAVFFAESRFRFHAASMLALASGVLIDQAVQSFRTNRAKVAGFAGAAAAIAALSITLGLNTTVEPVHWDHIVWGYIKMGRMTQAQTLAQQISHDQPDNGPIFEALGFTEAATKQYDAAATSLQRAVELRPRSHVAHFNLARVYLALGDRQRAAQEAQTALSLSPSPDYQALLSQIESGS